MGSIRLVADCVLDPRHGVLAFPLAVFLVGVLPAFRVKPGYGGVVAYFLAGYIGTIFKTGCPKGYG